MDSVHVQGVDIRKSDAQRMSRKYFDECFSWKFKSEESRDIAFEKMKSYFDKPKKKKENSNE